MNLSFASLAETAAPATKEASQSGLGSLMGLLPMVIVMGALIYLMYRSQKKEQKRREDMISSVAKGNKIVTVGGIHGLVEAVKDDAFTIKIAENVKIEVSKSAIAAVIDKENKEEKK